MGSLYISLVPKVHESVLKYSLPCSCIFLNDLKWIMGGYAKLSKSDKIMKTEKIYIVSLVIQMKQTIQEVIEVHLSQATVI